MKKLDRWAQQRFGRWVPLFSLGSGVAALVFMLSCLYWVIRWTANA